MFGRLNERGPALNGLFAIAELRVGGSDPAGLMIARGLHGVQQRRLVVIEAGDASRFLRLGGEDGDLDGALSFGAVDAGFADGGVDAGCRMLRAGLPIIRERTAEVPAPPGADQAPRNSRSRSRGGTEMATSRISAAACGKVRTMEAEWAAGP